ncbi:hypothetical protein Tco_0280279, partial [Tanacetum coccineum]
SDEGPSIYKDWSRGTKVIDGGSIGLKGGINVIEVVVKWNDGGRVGICEGIEVKGVAQVEHSSYFISHAERLIGGKNGSKSIGELGGVKNTRNLGARVSHNGLSYEGVLDIHWSCDGKFRE